MKNAIIVSLAATILGMLGVYFFALNKEVKKTDANTKEVINTEIATVTVPDSVNLSESQVTRMKVYQTLTNEMVVNAGSNDTFHIDCGTKLTPTQYDEIAGFFEAVCKPEQIPDDTTKVIEYPLFVHQVKATKDQALISGVAINGAIAVLNAKFARAKIHFTIKGSQDIVSERFTNFNEDDQPFLLNEFKKNKYINIFIFSSLKSTTGQPLNGYTTFARGDDFVMITAEALQNGTTLAHETGHYFLLYHTHGKSNSGTTDELVNGTSCSCTGDDVCDTPADPNLFGIVGGNCVYAGPKKDANGDLYKPDPKNLMSYAHLCRNYFTNGQYNKVRWASLKYRNYF